MNRTWVVLTISATLSPATAQAADVGGGGIARMHVEGLSGDAPPGDLAAAGLEARGFVGKDWLAYSAAITHRFGASLAGGFLYDARLSPLGLGARFGRTLLLASGFGVGVSAITSQIPVGMTLPLELLVALDVTEAVQLSLRAEAVWVPGVMARQAGADVLSFGDEQRFEIWLRVGSGEATPRWDWGKGYLVGAVYSEQLSTPMLGLLAGYALDGFQAAD